MCGTFLVRSGILNSVHTFANDPKRGIFILIFLFVLILGSLFIFIFLLTSKKEPKKYQIFTLLFQQIIIFGFFLFLLIVSNPFNYLLPIPVEGLRLNPI